MPPKDRAARGIGGTKCYAVGCSYGRAQYAGPKRFMFRFPEDPERRAIWIAATRRANKEVNRNSALCDAHFEHHFILDGFLKKEADGTVVYARRRAASLREDAVPTIFFDDQHEKRTHGGGHPEKEALPEDDEMDNPQVEVLALPPQTDFGLPEQPPEEEGASEMGWTTQTVVRIPSFEALVRTFEEPSHLPEELKLDCKWSYCTKRAGRFAVGGAGVMVFQLDAASSCPSFLKCLRIDTALIASAFYKTNNVSSLIFGSRMTSPAGSRIGTWNDLLTLLHQLDAFEPDRFQFNFESLSNPNTEEYGDILRQMNERKHQLMLQMPVNREAISKLNFHMEQIALLGVAPAERTFTDPLRKWTSFLHKKSPELLTFLGSSGTLTLPPVNDKLPSFLVANGMDAPTTAENMGVAYE